MPTDAVTPAARALAALDALADAERAATPGPWFWNSYSTIATTHFRDEEEEAVAEWEAAGSPTGPGDYPAEPWHRRMYDADHVVASVPPLVGDSAFGRHADDAKFIPAFRNAAPALLALARTAVARAEAWDVYLAALRAGGSDVRALFDAWDVLDTAADAATDALIAALAGEGVDDGE